METLEQARQDYLRIEKALRYLEENYDRQPTLKEIASAAALSEYHFQRLFGRWVGITPKRFLQFLTKEHAKACLRRSRSVLEATYDSGLTSPGRLHDLFVSCEAVTPGEYKEGGRGLSIAFGIHPTPFGDCLLATTGRGVCNLRFLLDDPEDDPRAWLARLWPEARLECRPDQTAPIVQTLFTRQDVEKAVPLHLHLKGTNFQIKVWEALLRIPSGHLVSYQDVAEMIGKPRAVRAVAGAVANNPISFIIPCHRVIRKIGEFHNYRWGAERKQAIIGWEMSRQAMELAAGG